MKLLSFGLQWPWLLGRRRYLGQVSDKHMPYRCLAQRPLHKRGIYQGSLPMSLHKEKNAKNTSHPSLNTNSKQNQSMSTLPLFTHTKVCTKESVIYASHACACLDLGVCLQSAESTSYQRGNCHHGSAVHLILDVSLGLGSFLTSS